MSNIFASPHLKFVVAFAGKVPGVVCVYFALFAGECVPDAHPFPIGVPRSFRLVRGAAGPPGEACGGGGTRRVRGGSWGGRRPDAGSYLSGRCRSRRTSAGCWSSRSPGWRTHTGPGPATAGASGWTRSAWWSQARSSLSSVTPEQKTLPLHHSCLKPFPAQT